MDGKEAGAVGDGAQGETRFLNAPHPSPKPGERVGHPADDAEFSHFLLL